MTANVPPTDLIELLGFAPDADPNTPGALIDCSLMIPNHRGMITPPVPDASADMGTTAGAYTATHSAIAAVAYQDGSARMFIATADGTFNVFLHKSIGQDSAFEVADPASGNATACSVVSFARFGDYVLACGDNMPLLEYEIGPSEPDDFTLAISGTIGLNVKWSHLVVAERFVLGFDGSSTSGVYNNDRWGCCARDNHQDWTPAAATLANTGRLPDEYGAFIGAIALGSLVYAFKSRTAYVGRFVGAPEVWQWAEWPYRIGAMCPPAYYRDSIIFLSSKGLYQFDGSNLRNLMDGAMLRYFIEQAPPGLGARLVVDEARDRAYISFSTAGPASLNDTVFQSNPGRTFVCHIPSGRWGKATLPNIDFYFSAPSAFGQTYSGFGPNEGDTIWAIEDASKRVHMLRDHYEAGDTTAAPFLVMNDFGDAFADMETTGVRVKYLTQPASSTLTPFYRNLLDAPLTTATAVPRSGPGDYNYRRVARWHRAKLEITPQTATGVEITGIRINTEARGTR